MMNDPTHEKTRMPRMNFIIQLFISYNVTHIQYNLIVDFFSSLLRLNDISNFIQDIPYEMKNVFNPFDINESK